MCNFYMQSAFVVWHYQEEKCTFVRHKEGLSLIKILLAISLNQSLESQDVRTAALIQIWEELFYLECLCQTSNTLHPEYHPASEHNLRPPAKYRRPRSLDKKIVQLRIVIYRVWNSTQRLERSPVFVFIPSVSWERNVSHGWIGTLLGYAIFANLLCLTFPFTGEDYDKVKFNW